MKNTLYKFTALAAAVLTAAACSDLDTYPEGEIVSPEQKEEAIRKDPSLINAELTAMNAVLIYCGADNTNNDFDFGYPALCMMYDANGPDFPGIGGGYNWFSGPALFQRDVANENDLLIWNTFYKYILAANSVLEVVPSAEGNPELALARGYAFAARAFAYLNLVQLYQFNYQDARGLPAVPIVTQLTENVNDNPRQKVEDVYNFLVTDLDSAVNILRGAAPRPDKSYIDLSVALGIRARARLAMGLWAEAAADAAEARASYPLLTLAEAGQPGFNSAEVNSCMWAALISPSNRAVTTAIVNWPSHMCSLTGAGYAVQVGAWRMISELLFEAIPASDVRKGWWVDEDLRSPIADNILVGEIPIAEARGFMPYTNVKFGPYQNIIGNATNASDWIIMRAEEMLLIEAEGLAMSGDVGGAKTLLEGWIQANRDASYACSASTPEQMQNEIWLQRRIELWGEGFSWFDIMRLRRNVVRMKGTESNFPDNQKFNVASDNPIMLWMIPQDEINGNAGITESDNNPVGIRPQPGDGAGLTDGVVVK